MITVTRTFETTEEAVAFLSGASPRAKATAAASTAVETAQTGKAKAEKTAAAAPAAAASAPAPAASAPAASAPKGDAAVDYPTLQKAVFKLAGIATGGRDAATALLAQFDVKTFKDLASDRWADALTAVNAKIDALAPVVA